MCQYSNSGDYMWLSSNTNIVNKCQWTPSSKHSSPRKNEQGNKAWTRGSVCSPGTVHSDINQFHQYEMEQFEMTSISTGKPPAQNDYPWLSYGMLWLSRKKTLF